MLPRRSLCDAHWRDRILGDDIADDITTTTSISVGGTLNSSIQTSGDLDYISISLVAGHAYTFSLDFAGTGPDSDGYLELRDSTGVLVAQNDDGGNGLDSFVVYTATQSGTFYIVARGFDGGTTGAYTLTTDEIATGQTSPSTFSSNGLPYFSWEEAAIQISRTGNSWATALNTPTVVTYAYRAGAPASMPSDTAGFSTFSAAQIAATEAALAAWASVANITFVRVNDGSGYSNNATILFGNYSSGDADAAAFAYLPGWPLDPSAGSLQGDVWVNISLPDNTDLAPGGYGAQVLLHEIGHALGLSHPGDYNAGQGNPTYPGSSDFYGDTRMFTLMSYFAAVNTGGVYSSYASLPQVFDIAAIQRLYGTNTSTRVGDTVYGFNSNTGISQYSLAFASSQAIFTIWDSGGNDTLDLSLYTTSSLIDLREESFSTAGPRTGGTQLAAYNIAIAHGVVIENAIGGSGDDTIIGNAANNMLTGGFGGDNISGNGGNDTIFGGGGSDFVSGGDGDDILDGGTGPDTINGGDGNDTIFWDPTDSTTGASGGAGTDSLVFLNVSAPTSFNLVTQGFEAAEGRFTDTGSNPWSTRTDIYDTQWRLDFSTTINDNGTREFTDYDQANAVNWANFVTRQDALLRTTQTVLTYDDGAHDTTDFDATNAVFWTSFVTRTDSLGRTTETLLIHDDGTRDTTNFDGDNTQFWTSFVTRRDALGRQTESLLIHDDGTRDTTNYDADNSQFWTSFVTRRDAGGNTTESLLIHDDGTRDTTNYDADNSQFWTSFVTRRDALGRQTESLLIHDDGTRDTTNFDPENNVFWSSFVTRRDSLGRTTDTLLIYDDGRRDSTDYDEANAFNWSHVVYRYDSGGTLYQTITTYDDGHIVTI